MKKWLAGLFLVAFLAGGAWGAEVTYHKEVEGAKTLVTPVVKVESGATDAAVNSALKALIEQEVVDLADETEPHELIVEGRAELLGKALLSFSFEGMVYFMGAAHPSSSRRGATFDAGTGDMLSLEDLFLPDTNWEGSLNECLFEAIDRQVAEEGLSVFNDEYPDVSEYHDQFFLRPGEFVFFWTDTQFSPHACGQPEFVVSRSDLEHLLRKKYAHW